MEGQEEEEKQSDSKYTYSIVAKWIGENHDDNSAFYDEEEEESERLLSSKVKSTRNLTLARSQSDNELLNDCSTTLKNSKSMQNL